MRFFAVQVLTGHEGKFVDAARRLIAPEKGRVFWPRRSLRIRKAGKWRDSLAPVFAGYVFFQLDAIEPELYRGLKEESRFVRFLPSNDRVRPLDGNDLEILSHFISFGEILDRSRVLFDEDNRIRVISGPLKGLEGRITKVDRRKRRARVRLSMYESSFEIDFGFDHIEPEKQHTGV